MGREKSEIGNIKGPLAFRQTGKGCGRLDQAHKTGDERQSVVSRLCVGLAEGLNSRSNNYRSDRGPDRS